MPEERTGNDDSTREEPGFGDDNLTQGPIVEAQLADMGILDGEPTSKESKNSDVEEIFEAAEADESQEESGEEEAESPKADDEGNEEVVELEKSNKLDEPESESKKEEEEEPEEDVDEEPEEEPEEEDADEPSELESLQAQNTKLMELLNLEEALVEDEEPPAEEPAEEPANNIPLTSVALPEVTQESLDEIVSSPEAFNNHIKNIFDAGQQSIFSVLPRIINAQVETQRVVDRFFDANPELIPLDGLVKKFAMKAQKDNTSLDAAAALKEGGKSVRAMLKMRPLKEESKGKKPKSKKKPRFAPATSRRTKPLTQGKKKGKKADPKSFETQFGAMEEASGRR